MIQIYNIDQSNWYKVKDISNIIKLRKTQYDSLVKNIKKNPILKNYYRFIKSNTNGGVQSVMFIQCLALPFLLASLNYKSMNDDQIEILSELLNYYYDNKIYIEKDNRKIYAYESHLRDELFEIGKLNDIIILDKEKTYKFGRIDLYGIDESEKKCCIELKKYAAYKYLKEQLQKYKKSMEFDRVIYMSYDIDEEIERYCIDNGIEYVIYKRILNFDNVVGI